MILKILFERPPDVSDELRSKYSTTWFYFDILTILCILQIGVSVVIFIAAFTSGQARNWPGPHSYSNQQ